MKAALEEMGHHYPVTTLSPTLLRQVRKRNLRRLKHGQPVGVHRLEILR